MGQLCYTVVGFRPRKGVLVRSNHHTRAEAEERVRELRRRGRKGGSLRAVIVAKCLPFRRRRG